MEKNSNYTIITSKMMMLSLFSLLNIIMISVTIGVSGNETEGVANETLGEAWSIGEVLDVKPDNVTRVAGLFDIYSDHTCSNINKASVQALESVVWIFEQLNLRNYIPGVKLVMQPYKTCRYPRLASLQTAHVVTEMEDKTIMGVIGPSTSAEMNITSEILSSLPEYNRLPQVVYEPTSSVFTNKDTYNNLFRVIPPDNTQVKTIIALMKKLNWNYISVIREDDIYAINATEHLRALANTENICISSVETVGQISDELAERYQEILSHLSEKQISGIVFFGSYAHATSFIQRCEVIFDMKIPSVIFSDAASSTTIQPKRRKVLSNAFFLSPPTRNISEFAVHWEKIASNRTYLLERAVYNPWLLDEPVWDMGQSIYVQYSIKAAYVMTLALKTLHGQLCGEDVSGACTNFVKADRSALIDILSTMTVNFTDFPFNISSFVQDGLKIQFDRHGEIKLLSPHVPMYEVFRYDDCSGPATDTLCKVKVARYKNDILHFIENVQELKGYGNAQCSQSCPECMTNDLPSEDIYLPGDWMVVGLMPLHNQDSKSPFACGGIRSKIGLDVALAIHYVVNMVNNASDMFRGKTIGYKIMDTCNDPIVTQKRILDMLSEDGDYHKRILGVVGPLGSTTTIAAAGIFSNLGIVQVGCCSSARILSNKNMYPTFLRVSTSIHKQAELMVRIASKMKANYIQVVYSEGEFGESGRDAIFQLAQEYNICVVNDTISVGENKDEYYKVLPHIRRYSDARLVILFIRSHKASEVAQALNERLDDDDFIFMASDAWGNREDNIQNRRNLRGMITISQEMGYDKGYEDFLLSINVTQDRYKNSFLERFAEARLGCYFESSFNKSGKPKCFENHMIKPTTLDPWHSFVLNAAHALLHGANNAFEERPSYHMDGETNFLLNHIKKVHQKYGIVGSKTNMFDDKGDGMVGFNIYNVQINKTSPTEQLIYVKVGYWKDESLKFNQSQLDDRTKSLDSKCKSSGNYNQSLEEEDILRSILYGVIGLLAGILTTLSGRHFCQFIRKKRKQAKESRADDDLYYLPRF